VVALLNAMPKPVTLPCFLETLARPLDVYAALSLLSLQPASGRRSPRLFLFLDRLILSVVPEGTGSALAEFGELQSDTRSLKGELEFPIIAELTEQAPFESVLFNDKITNCAFCHRDEQPAEALVPFTGAFVSQALQPRPDQRVALSELDAEVLACDATLEPERCAILKSIFGHGDVRERDFPATMETF
jgi:hypothetical protein